MRQSEFFIRAKEEEKRWTSETKSERGRERAAELSGEEVKDFYQSLFKKEDGVRHEEKKEERKRERRRGRARQRHGKGGEVCEVVKSMPPAGSAEGYRLLRCAEQGDVRGMEELLRRGCDLNFRDQFNWSALMSAAFSGRREAVQVLLQKGALWTRITDTQGRDARDLASVAGHHDVVRLLEQFNITHNSHTSHTPAEQKHSTPPSQWCKVCEVYFTDSAHTHTSSTLHQFSLKRPPSLPHYCLTPSSTGYKLMLRLGWDPRSGLGPEHSGRRDPIGTVLKSDTAAGLGFGPHTQVEGHALQGQRPASSVQGI
ncbi:G patch domain and ankyrin repeat-containing protein 1 [Bagarius yarrelli]|uniref:G patch domain and ankyrin repeat-containing protein 1 n=1 Tax=Bagarius yarrelli TaxID=175774 RepID=A0A556VAU3_BAGYA|nr:G patch domain and ankyrin repeat-containing protein 1 [Bagarius yarrelli]